MSNTDSINTYVSIGRSLTLSPNLENNNGGYYRWFTNNFGSTTQSPINNEDNTLYTSASYTPPSTLTIGTYIYICKQIKTDANSNIIDTFTTTFNYVVQPNQPYIQEIDVSNAKVTYGTQANILIKVRSNTYYTLNNYNYNYKLYQKISDSYNLLTSYDTRDSYFSFNTGITTSVGIYNYKLTITAIYNNIESSPIDSPEFTITIDKQDVIIYPSSKTIFVGDPDPIFTYTTSVNPNPFSGTLTTTSTSRDVGTYLINTGLTSSNYNPIYQPALLVVVDRAVINSNNDNFETTKNQILTIFDENSSNSNAESAEIIVIQDKNTPETVQVTVYNVSELTSPDQTSIPLETETPIEGVSDISIDTSTIPDAAYIIATVIPINESANIPTTDSSPILFSLYFKALDNSGNSVVSRLNPFVINVTLNDTQNIKLIKFVNGAYVILEENADYGLVKSGNNFRISFYSNSFISIAKNNDIVSYFSVLKNHLYVGEKQRLVNASSYFNFNFYSSNSKVAKIDYMGYVTPLSEGYFYVIVTDRTGRIIYTSSFLIKVEKNPEDGVGSGVPGPVLPPPTL
jgi:hypothetical protein